MQNSNLDEQIQALQAKNKEIEVSINRNSSPGKFQKRSESEHNAASSGLYITKNKIEEALKKMGDNHVQYKRN